MMPQYYYCLPLLKAKIKAFSRLPTEQHDRIEIDVRLVANIKYLKTKNCSA